MLIFSSQFEVTVHHWQEVMAAGTSGSHANPNKSRERMGACMLHTSQLIYSSFVQSRGRIQKTLLGWVFPHQLADSRHFPHRYIYRANQSKQFITKNLFLVDSKLCQVDYN